MLLRYSKDIAHNALGILYSRLGELAYRWDTASHASVVPMAHAE